MIDVFALSRSGHTVIRFWLGMGKHCNRENDRVDGPGIVVLREFSAWLASFMCMDKVQRGHSSDAGEGQKKTPHPPESLDTVRWAIDIWRDHAAAYQMAEVDDDDVVAVSSYHFATSSMYRSAVQNRVGFGGGCSVDDPIHSSSWDTGVDPRKALILQRWRKAVDSPEADDYRMLMEQSKDCLVTSQEIFRVNFEKEVLG